MMKRLVLFLLLSVGLIGSCGPDTYWITVVFPDQTAIDQTATLQVFVIDPGQGSVCARLLDGTVNQGEAGYEVESGISISDWDSGQAIAESIDDVSKGDKLFFAQCRDSNAKEILRACESLPTSTGDITLNLEWI